ncbi:NEDD4-binding protein 2 [Frankliniella fusca]|uniref:NEDD4-binding protein 2 n=1 Tax=Frankliniella fusca TaxID=407009 RepID=A0AAE1I176_9NEOP|nr:NEDD4-binding protein 2 [Frankliniella fusca]
MDRDNFEFRRGLIGGGTSSDRTLRAAPWRAPVYDRAPAPAPAPASSTTAPGPASAPRPRPRSSTTVHNAATGAGGGGDDDDEEEVLTLVVDQEFMEQLQSRFGGGDELSSDYAKIKFAVTPPRPVASRLVPGRSTIVRVPVSFASQIHYYALLTQLQEREEEYEAERRRLEEDEAVARLLYQEQVESQRRANLGAVLGAGGDREGLPPAERAPAAAQAEPEERRQGQNLEKSFKIKKRPQNRCVPVGQAPAPQTPEEQRGRPESRDAQDFFARIRLEDRFPSVDKEMVHFLFNSLGSEEATVAALEEQLAHSWPGPGPQPTHRGSSASSGAGVSRFLENEARGEAASSGSGRAGGLQEQQQQPERAPPSWRHGDPGEATASSALPPLEDADGDGVVVDENPWDSTDPMLLHTKYRNKADTSRRERDSYNSKAKAAYQSTNRESAGLYAQKGALFEQRYEYYSAMAIAALLAAHRDTVSASLDLHSFRVGEAVIVLDLFLDHYIRRLADGQGSDDRLSVITGKGMHSAGGRPRVKPAVLERVRQRRLRFEEFPGNRGAIRVFITQNSLLGHQVPKGPSSSR